MGERELWVRDISKLKELGKTNIVNIANDIKASSVTISSLDLDPSAFGVNDIRFDLEKAHEAVQRTLVKQLNAAHEGLYDSGVAIAKAADHYHAIESRMAE